MLLNSIKYDKQPSDDDFAEMNRKSKLVTIDWKGILPDPPDNTSDITKKELEYLEKITSKLSRKEVDLVMKVDANPVNLFYDEYRTPLFTDDLVDGLDLLINKDF